MMVISIPPGSAIRFPLSRMSCLLNIPVELILLILGHLGTVDLLQCTLVSKHLRQVVQDSSSLQYTLELSKHRMVSLLDSTHSLPFSSRLKFLHNRERAWKYLEWKGRQSLKLPPTGSIYEFVGGIYGNGREDDRRITASISFMELPTAPLSQNAPQDLKMWTHSMSDITIIDFTMDPSQDLLILVALAPSESKFMYELHMRRISTNQTHPKAPLPILPCLSRPGNSYSPPNDFGSPAVRIQVAGDLVALLIKEVLDSAGAHLEIWNWEHGPQYSCSMTRISGIDDFTFLAHDSFLLVRPTGRFEVYRFEDPRSASNSPTLIASYYFPPLADGYMYWYISMSSNPAPGYVPRPSSDSTHHQSEFDHRRQIYYPRSDERIHACCLYIFNPSIGENNRVHSFVFFINIRTFLDPPADWYRNPDSRHSSIKPLPKPASATSSSSDTDSNLSWTTYPRTSSRGSTSVDIPIQGSSLTGMAAESGQSTSAEPLADTSDTVYYDLPIVSATNQWMPISHSYPPFPAFQPTIAPHPSNATSQNQSAYWQHTATLADPAYEAPHIPWETWGPNNTRWFEESLSTDWQHAIYGLRTVETVRIKTRYKDAESHVLGETFAALATEFTENEIDAETHAESSEHLNDDAESSARSQDTNNQRRYLRIRDFNPYSISQAVEAEANEKTCGNGKSRANWHTPRLVKGISVTKAKGVFKNDILSWLPYTEVISEETFEVTDVMMDDCRLLLLKRGPAGKLKRVDVLTM